MKTSKKAISIILTIVGIACLLGAVFLWIRRTAAERENEAMLEALRASAESMEAANPELEEGSEEETPQNAASEASQDTAAQEFQNTSSENSAVSEPDTSDTSEYSPAMKSDSDADKSEAPSVPNPYKDSYLANEDMAAWLQIPDTNIDYPVMWTPEDENYYLYRDFDGNDNQNGCLILDTDSSLDPLTTNLIIHGHNMRSGAMFGNLTDYESRDYYEKHKNIILYTEECRRNYEIIAIFRSQVFRKSDRVFKFYKFFQADTQEEFDDFYNNIKEMSLYDTGVTAEFGDHFITLSTCVYHVEQGRFVVVAKEVESGDTYLPVRE